MLIKWHNILILVVTSYECSFLQKTAIQCNTAGIIIITMSAFVRCNSNSPLMCHMLLKLTHYRYVLQYVLHKAYQPTHSTLRIVSNTRKFDRGLTHFRRSQLHWLDVVDRVRFRVCVQVFRCLHKMAPEYLSTYCQPVSGISGRRHLRSADRGHLDFPRVKLASYGERSFAYAGPSNWNSLPAHLRDNSLTFSFIF